MLIARHFERRENLRASVERAQSFLFSRKPTEILAVASKYVFRGFA